MAYLETIESSTTWICPKTGYYQVICVGGGGGGGGAGFHSLGVLFTKGNHHANLTIGGQSPIKGNDFRFSSQNGGFIKSTTGGSKGGSGSPTSFGSYLTARGGNGGNGGGASLGTKLSEANLSPKGGESLFSSGGSGMSLSSISGAQLTESTPYYPFSTGPYIVNSPYHGFHYGTPYQINNESGINTNAGILSAVSGGGGAGGEVSTTILYITKGKAIPCTIGVGGVIGGCGMYDYNTQFTVSGTAHCTSPDSLMLGGVKSALSSEYHYYGHLCEYNNLFLSAKVIGGGGGGGFTFEHSGGRGSDSIATPIIDGFEYFPYNFCPLFKCDVLPPSINGGMQSRGIGYGAGGSGGGMDIQTTLGLCYSNSHNYSGIAVSSGKTVNWSMVNDIIKGNMGGPYNKDTESFPETVTPAIPDYFTVINASSGANGAIVIREVS